MPTIEELEKKLDTKLSALSQDVEAGVLKKIREETKEQFAELKKSRDFTPETGKTVSKYARLQPFIDIGGGDESMPEVTRAFSGFAKAVQMREHGRALPDTVVKAMGETQGSTGGFFVPIEFKNELLKLIIEGQVVRPRATVIPMQTDLARIPRIVDSSHASSIHGGVKGTFGVEGGSLGTGDPAAGQVELKAKKFSDYITVSNELIQDSPIAIAPLLSVLLKEGLGFFEDVSALFGAGANAMQGCMSTTTNPALIATTRDSTGNLTYQDIVNMYARMFPSSLDKAVWVCSPSVFPALATMTVSAGTGGSGVWISNYNTAVGAPPATIFGRPVVISEKMAQLGTTGDIAFCDFGYYLIGDRMGLAITSSDQVAFATDQTAFRAIERLDGAVWLSSALTPNKQTDTLSAFVTVAT